MMQMRDIIEEANMDKARKELEQKRKKTAKESYRLFWESNGGLL